MSSLYCACRRFTFVTFVYACVSCSIAALPAATSFSVVPWVLAVVAVVAVASAVLVVANSSAMLARTLSSSAVTRSWNQESGNELCNELPKDLEEVVGREEAITDGVGWVGTGFVGKGGDGVW